MTKKLHQKKIAVILFNLGAPDKLSSVRPFLFNLFRDPAIIRLPLIFRYLLAFTISSLRYFEAKKIYAELGGGSPLLKNSQSQALALERALNSEDGMLFKSFIAMRYWHPMAKEVVRDVKKWQPDFTILLPLYPQYSTTTTASSVQEWRRWARKCKLTEAEQLICCYPLLKGFVKAQAEKLRKAMIELGKKEKKGNMCVLFSAHGLPEKISSAGDPYRDQVEASAQAIADYIGEDIPEWRVSFQSRVGPMEWLKPYTDEEIKLAGKEGKSLLIVPLTFVSEHSETLIELDVEYGELAEEAGVKFYKRVGTVDDSPDFINGLKEAIFEILESKEKLAVAGGGCFCGRKNWACPHFLSESSKV